MAPILCQKWWTNFCQIVQNFVLVGPHDFLKISPVCRLCAYQKCVEKTQISSNNINLIYIVPFTNVQDAIKYGKNRVALLESAIIIFTNQSSRTSKWLPC